MRPFHKKESRLQRLIRPVSDSLERPLDVMSSMPRKVSPKARNSGLAAAGGLVGLTAGSAAVSSLRRRSKGSRNNS
jgi:hypothetical protein